MADAIGKKIEDQIKVQARLMGCDIPDDAPEEETDTAAPDSFDYKAALARQTEHLKGALDV